MKAQTISEIIKEARGPENQASFAAKFDISQASVSKYENGSANPPMNVVNACIKIIQEKNDLDVSADALASRLKKFSGPSHIHMRKVIESLLNAAKI